MALMSGSLHVTTWRRQRVNSLNETRAHRFAVKRCETRWMPATFSHYSHCLATGTWLAHGISSASVSFFCMALKSAESRGMRLWNRFTQFVRFARDDCADN